MFTFAAAVLSFAGLCASGGASVDNVYAGDLPNAPGKRLSVITVTYPPGAKSAPHRHDAFVFAYVLSGRVRSRVDDGPVREYAAGQSWTETPNALHAVSENASATEPATFLVVFVAESGAALSAPAR